MDQLIAIFSNLTIAFIGFVVPLMGTLIAIYRSSSEKLRMMYEDQLSIKKKAVMESEKGPQIHQLKKNVNLLYKEQKRLEKRIRRLNPQRQMLIIVIPLFMSIILIASYYPLKSLYAEYKTIEGVVLLSLSILSLSWGMFSTWQLIDVIIEVQKFIDDDKKEVEHMKITLLEALLDKVSNPSGDNIHVMFEGQKIDGQGEIQFSTDNKHLIKVCLNNNEHLMLKNIEAGIEISKDYVAIGDCEQQLTEVDGKHVITYCVTLIHSGKTHDCGQISLTFLKAGTFELMTFIKAENINKPIYRKLKVKVVDSKSLVWKN